MRNNLIYQLGYVFFLIFIYPIISYSVSISNFNSEIIDTNWDANTINVLKDLEDGKLDKFTYLEAALIIGGITDNLKRNQYTAYLFEKAEKYNLESLLKKASLFDAGNVILEFLHKQIFKNYNLYSTTLEEIFFNGRYNCVSSTVLYNALCIHYGYETKAVMKGEEHVFSLFKSNTKYIDVETTTIRGYNPKDKDLKEFTKITGFETMGRSGTNEFTTINNLELLALSAMNKGNIDIKNNKKFYEGVRNLILSLKVNSNFAMAISSLEIGYSNWCAYLGETKGDYELAIRVAEEGLKLYPNSKNINENLIAVYQKLASKKAKIGDYQSAIDINMALYNRFNKDEIHKYNVIVYYIEWAYHYVENKKYDEARVTLNKAKEMFPESDKLQIAHLNTYFMEAQDLSKQNKWDEGLVILNNLMTKNPNDPKVKEITSNYYYNYCVYYYQKSDYDNAIKVLSKSKQNKIWNNTLNDMYENSYCAWLLTLGSQNNPELFKSVIEKFESEMPKNKQDECIAYGIQNMVKVNLDKNNFEKALSIIKYFDKYINSKKQNDFYLQIYIISINYYINNYDFNNGIIFIEKYSPDILKYKDCVENIGAFFWHNLKNALNKRDPDFASKIYYKGIEYFKKYKKDNECKIWYQNSAIIFYQNNFYKTAIKISIEGLEEYPNSNEIYKNLLAFYQKYILELLQKENYDEARKTVNEALERYKNDSWLLNVKKQLDK